MSFSWSGFALFMGLLAILAGVIGLVAGRLGPIRGRFKMLWLLGGGVLFAFALFPTLAVTEGRKPSATSIPSTIAPTPTVSAKADVPSTTSPPQEQSLVDAWIRPRAEFQSQMDKGRQKVVIYIQNEHKDMFFTGSVVAHIKGAGGADLGGDTIYPENLPPRGQTYAVVWAKPGGVSASFTISGSLKKGSVPSLSTGVEITATVGGLNYQTFYVIADDPSSANLVRIARDFRLRYPSTAVNGFQIFFYDRAHAAEAKSKAMEAALADYSANYKNGLSELFISATGEKFSV